MDVTLVIAIIGAVTGTGSLATHVYSTARDRPRVLLNFGSSDDLIRGPTIWLEVTNVGHRATTVREVGFFAKESEAELMRDGEVYGRTRAELHFPFGESIFLEPGQSRRFEQRPDTVGFNLHADFPLRAYARDIRGRRIWGGAAPLLRMLVGTEAKLPGDASEDMKRLLAPLDAPLYPAQVEPRWKIWKRKELRKPETWRP